MQPITLRLVLGGALVGFLCGIAGPNVPAQDGDDENAVVHLHGVVELVPPEGEAGGAAFLRQVGDRAAIHVYVSGLEPGATYDVQMVMDDVPESIGTITTHSGEVPPPSHFHARLESPDCEDSAEEPDDPADDGDTAEDGADGDGHHHGMDGWMDRLRDFLEGFRSRWGFWSDCPRGYAIFIVNSERTGLEYYIHVRNVTDAATAVTLEIGDESIALDTDSLNGSVEVTEEQLVALGEGQGSLVVELGDVVVEGALEVRFQELRERIAEHRAGRGALRLDTARGDVLPFGAASIEELVGAALAVLSEGGDPVLGGVIEELLEGGRWYCRPRWGEDDDPDPDPEPAEEEAGTGAFFELGVPHDASFIRGDANDDGAVDLSDAVYVLDHLFLGGAQPYCGDAADANDDGQVEISDPIVVLNALFQGTTVIPVPYPESGYDPSADELTCE